MYRYRIDISKEDSDPPLDYTVPLFYGHFVYIMADEEGIGDIDDDKPEDQTVKKAAAKHDSVRATDLEKVTDYVEEAEISSNNISDVRNLFLVMSRQVRTPCGQGRKPALNCGGTTCAGSLGDGSPQRDPGAEPR